MNSLNKIFRRLHYIVLPVFFLFSCSGDEGKSVSDMHTIAHEMEGSLNDQLINIWYPMSIDTIYGGFLSDFKYDWTPDGPHDKMIVTHARHVWTTSKMAAFYPEDSLRFLGYATHGFNYLKDRMWDMENGGFHNLLTREGEVIKDFRSPVIIKTAYGNAFAIYGLAAYYKVSGNEEALDLAKEAFYWLEEHSYDSINGGYYQNMTENGDRLEGNNRYSFPKDQNSSIHLLEAFSELYLVWQDEVLRQRLQELLVLIRDTMVSEGGSLRLYFSEDWKPFSLYDSVSVKDYNPGSFYADHISFGHDIETAYLLLEASEVLGLENDTTTEIVAKKMTDYTLRNGWDPKGGVYDGGYNFKDADSITIINRSKQWWGQAEAMNTLLIMADKYPDDPLQYKEKFKVMWDYIKQNLIDQEHGGWYPGAIDIDPEYKTAPKAQIWKCNYHTSRSLMNCLKRLEKYHQE